MPFLFIKHFFILLSGENSYKRVFRRPLRDRCLHYLLRYIQLYMKLLDSIDLLTRFAELSRLFGLDFASVISRGSQYRVEAMLCRATHPIGFLLLTASKKQVNRKAK